VHADYWVGAAAQEITPPSEWIAQRRIHLWGYASRSGPALGVRDTIGSRALAIRDSANTCIVLVAVDVCVWHTSLSQTIRVRVTRATGIPGEHILINVTHTHSAPVTVVIPTWNPGVDHPEVEYLKFLQDQVIGSIIQAVGQQQLATLHWTRGRTRIGINRHVQDGVYDETLDVLVVMDGRENPIAIAFFHGCHPTALTDLDVISADYVGVARDIVEQTHGGIAIFFQGCAGTIKPAVKEVVQTGKTLGEDVNALVHGSMNGLSGAIRTHSLQLELALQPVDPSALERAKSTGDPNLRCWAEHVSRLGDSNSDKLATQIQGVRIGARSSAWYLAASAHEIVAEFTKPIRAIAPSQRLTLLGYTHSQMAYLPTQDVLANPACEFPAWQNYEGSMAFVWYGHRAPFTPESENMFITSHTKLFDALGEDF
jgi:hypothetical protein